MGPPMGLLSENGPQFRARLFQEICNIDNTKKKYMLPDNTQTIGQTEHMNHTLATIFRIYVAEEQHY